MKIRRVVATAVIAGLALVAGAVVLPIGAQPSPADVTNATQGGAVERGAAAGAAADGAAAERGAALLQRARGEADPRYLPQAAAAFRQSLRLQPDRNVPALIGMAALANARHDFNGSVRWARRAIAANAYSASAHGLLGDALFELGRVRASAAAYQRMVDLRPDTASYIRASYALQHQGATAAAIRAMKLALQAAGPTGETAAYVEHQLGDLYAGQQRYRRSEQANRRGTQRAPGFIPPTVGIAEAFLARGELHRALPILEHAVQELPTIEYMVTLGDVYAVLGRRAQAQMMYGRVSAALASYRRSGVKPDSDFIVFYADHDVRPIAALREAFEIFNNRPTAKVADALAWMLHAVGRDAEAVRYARRAIDGRGASAMAFFHAAQIERAVGNGVDSARLLRRALRLDPAFSVIGVPRARSQLAALRRSTTYGALSNVAKTTMLSR